MGTPRSRTENFEVGGVKLYHYFARDAHGTVVNTYMADGHEVSHSEFIKIIKDSLSGAESYIGLALGMIKVGV